MREYTMFNYNFVFGDYMAKVSNQAKLYYIELNFFANNGFVANPMKILDSLGYDKSVFMELVASGELLTLPDRCEVFIASYFLHNKGMKPLSWLSSPFAVYWKGKLYIKKNGIVTFTPQGDEKEESDKFQKYVDDIMNHKSEETEDETYDWDGMMRELEEQKQK